MCSDALIQRRSFRSIVYLLRPFEFKQIATDTGFCFKIFDSDGHHCAVGKKQDTCIYT